MSQLQEQPTNDIPSTPHDIQIQDYLYDLPEARIASFPLPERDAAKLLIYRKGQIGESVFHQLPDLLPDNALLLFNDTRVIQARMKFQNKTGDSIEVFCLEPLLPVDYVQNFSAQGTVHWKSLIGNNRKWKDESLIKHITTPAGEVTLQVDRIGRFHDAFEVAFSWNLPITFAEVLYYAGIIPLPPYLRRESTVEDETRYQTVYAREKGSVAAPTAGLHFTDRVLQALKEKNIDLQFATLHVGAGTFKPVQPGPLRAHHMHQEHIYLSRDTIEALYQALQKNQPIIPVGTTSLRILESLYWLSESITERNLNGEEPFVAQVEQWAPYAAGSGKMSPQHALKRLLDYLDAHSIRNLEGSTTLLIAPGYSFRLASGLITNFHQPGSTLLLLIAALIGPSWRSVYQYALEREFRFLSYGDSSLILP